MNRRSFFSRVLGFGLGLLGVKAQPERRSGTEYICTNNGCVIYIFASDKYEMWADYGDGKLVKVDEWESKI